MHSGRNAKQDNEARLVVILTERTPLRRVVGAAGVGVGVGAALAYLLDPDRGRARRARARDKAVHARHRLDHAYAVASRDLGNRGHGLVAGARYRVNGRKADDRILHGRVRETLGRHVRHPSAVEVTTEGGTVRLGGDVLAAEAHRAERAVHRVPGVRRVETTWRVRERPGNVPGLQGDNRARDPVPELLQQQWSPAARLVAGSAAVTMWAMSGGRTRPVASALRGAGSLLGARAATNLPLKRLTGIGAGRRAIEVQDAVCVPASPERVWELLTDYDALPRIMPDIREVHRDGDGSSRWEISGPAGSTVRFQAEETKREEGHEISWRTTDGQLVAHAGSLRLDPEDDGRTRGAGAVGVQPGGRRARPRHRGALRRRPAAQAARGPATAEVLRRDRQGPRGRRTHLRRRSGAEGW